MLCEVLWLLGSPLSLSCLRIDAGFSFGTCHFLRGVLVLDISISNKDFEIGHKEIDV